MLFDKWTNELQKKIGPQFPDVRFRTASCSSTLLQVTDTKDETEYQSIQS
ncbi:hypothetical protein M993_04326 [Obesumbacterium proteus ATCC 12841]|uniref:Uncharacterized protein n=1 Tax=Obesumbacterium proteus ATCC 12841 TaxID=1354268 RepID=A0AA91EE71_9GAMM|nr:hypothetical protein M993_04326 [Obesumbacterium proteus ATCC 12841]